MKFSGIVQVVVMALLGAVNGQVIVVIRVDMGIYNLP